MMDEICKLFEAWWVDFQQEHEDWKFADREAILLAAFIAGQKAMRERATELCGNEGEHFGEWFENEIRNLPIEGEK